MEDQSVLARGIVERIGESVGIHTYNNGKEKKKSDNPIPNHTIGLETAVALLVDGSVGVIADKSEIAAVAHRVVHGGETFKKPTIIDHEVLEAIRDNLALAPLHNPANIMGIELAQKIFPTAKQVAIFDTAFHHTIPPSAYHYAIPMELYHKHKIRRYGFHGSSHHYVAIEAAKMLAKPLEESNLISVHLGNGGSITAIKNGKSVDTSMGLTPLEGLIMGTRSGDIDPAIPYFLVSQTGMDIGEVNDILNKKSGVKGICGMNDMREIEDAVAEGNEAAIIAFDMYNYRIKKYVGAYAAALGRVDAIIFTAGIGENAPLTRTAVCQDMDCLGIQLDEAKNATRSKDPREISSAESSIKVIVIPTNEELMIARETAKLI